MTKGTRHGQNEKARHLMRRSGYKVGGHTDKAADTALISKAFSEHDNQLHGGKKTHLKLKEGGAVEGRATGGRLDKMARGGHKKGKPHVTVNVMNHPQQPISPQIPPIPVGLPAGGPRPMPAPPPMGAGGPPGGPPMGGGPMGPGGMKRGGRTKLASGGQPTQGYSKGKIPGPSTEEHLASGGRLSGRAAPKMTAGAASGEGREEKIKFYGTKPKAK